MIKTMEELEEDLCEFCPMTGFGEYKVNTGPLTLCEGARCDTAYEHYLEDYYENQHIELEEIMKEKKVIFNKKTTVVLWDDGTKTVVKCSDDDTFNKATGFLMAYFQKHTGMNKTTTSKFFNDLNQL